MSDLLRISFILILDIKAPLGVNFDLIVYLMRICL